MCLRPVGNLIAHARPQSECATIRKLGIQLPAQAEENVSLFAPVICAVSSGVIHHPHTDGAELAGAPHSGTSLAVVIRRLDGAPVGGAEGDVSEEHVPLTEYARKTCGWSIPSLSSSRLGNHSEGSAACNHNPSKIKSFVLTRRR